MILTPEAIPPKPCPQNDINMPCLFSMYEYVPRRHRPSDIRDEIDVLQNTPLRCAYLSTKNMQMIQNGIRAKVYELSKNNFIISEQDSVTLKQIMIQIFNSNVRDHINNSQQTIITLNNFTVEVCAKQIYERAKTYLKYVETQGEIPTPMAQPAFTSIKNEDVKMLPIGL
tara:strand:+ start:172 stop:681 length:510 start_codon:yes stop_codon:yes gene_type:complete